MTSPNQPETPGQQAAKPADEATVITDPKKPEGDAAETGANGAASPAAPAEEFAQASAAPPPWQRVTVTSQQSPPAPETQQESSIDGPTTAFRPVAPAEPAPPAPPQPDIDAPTVFGSAAPTAPPDGLGALGRETVNFSAAATTPRPAVAAPSARRTGRGPRRAALQVKRVDPWSVLKLALVLSVALFFVWLVAVGVLYGVLQGMGVWDSLNNTYKDLVTNADGGAEPLISAGRVFGVAAVVGVVNIVLFTALATVSAFVYNVSADLAGGVEVTLSERE
ncbi:hypothetical protein JOF53_004390 [Crossiella equi]|uniref:DUF3566 domain-containing protein n=1 Tax=Crossiella equi TaxID=130796 RepID=A0ABS5AG08_9PSEU|nr:DUF3566 domain-containing protein [Crossiella equi]MBP2475518.1 hypothetical protein [Crossiella equi]